MWRTPVALLALLVSAGSPATTATTMFPGEFADEPMLGRWDITIRTPDGERPSWLELSHSGRDVVVGQFVGIVGSARPISRVVVTSDSLHFAIPPQWESGNGDLTVDGRLTENRLAGAMMFPDGKRYDWTGVRAPLLKRDHAPKWGAPIRLLHANDLAGWRAVGGE